MTRLNQALFTERNEAQLSAQTLARALRDAIWAMRQGNRLIIEKAIVGCEAALAAWEARQQ